MEQVDIGKKISQCRKKKKITLAELAQKTGVSVSMLSQIERNLANPSLNTVEAISAALEVPMFYFFAGEETDNDMVVHKDNRIRVSNSNTDGSFYELLTPTVQGSIEFALLTLKPNSYMFEQALYHVGEEVAVVTKGVLQVIMESKTLLLEAGDSIRILPYTRHRLFNPGKKDTEVIFAISPPSF